MATFSKQLVIGLGLARTGLAASISYKVYDAAGVLKLTRTNVMTEEVTASGAGSGSYYHVEAGFDDTWSFPLRVTWLVTGFELSIPSDVIEAPSSTGGEVTLAAVQPNYAPAKAGDAMTLTSGERMSIATSVWSSICEGTKTFKEFIRVIAASATGNSNGNSFKGIDGTTTRLEGTVDSDGNRTVTTWYGGD